MNTKVRTEASRNNLFVMMCHTVVVAVIILAYIVEVFKGKRSVPYILIVSLLGLVPVIAEHIFYRKNNETTAIKHLVGFGFAAFYLYLLFTATSQLTFTYVIILILAISAFNDKKFALEVNIGVVIANIIQIIIGAKTGTLGYVDLAGAEIQVILLIVVAGISIVLSHVLDLNSRQKLALISEQQKQSEELYNKTMETARIMTEDIENIYAKIEELLKTANITKNAMEEVTNGSTDTAEAVQRQLLQTQSIQQYLSEVDTAANAISEEMRLTKDEISSGKVNMGQMVTQVNESVDIGGEVARQLEALDGNIKEMYSIIEIISGITSRTSLLALNASIEAARAGDSGRGFAVVATQISEMASQTKSATVHITELIQNLSGAITEVVSVIRQMIDGINAQKDVTKSTENSFIRISDSSSVMDKSITSLSNVLASLVKANVEIVDSIQTISGVTEEVSAHASETFNSEAENTNILTEIAGLMSDLKSLAQKL